MIAPELDEICPPAQSRPPASRKRESYLDRLAARVSVLLDLYWSHVQVTACALLDRGTLTGREVQDLLREK